MTIPAVFNQSELAAKMAAFSPEITDRVNQLENFKGVDTLPRLKMDRSSLQLLRKGVPKDLGSSANIIILGVCNDTNRQYMPDDYDKENKQPPKCFSIDSKVPFGYYNGELAGDPKPYPGTPMVNDPSTGLQRHATTCSECPEGSTLRRCRKVRNVVAILKGAAITAANMFVIPVGNVSLFHKSDLKGITAENATNNLSLQAFVNMLEGMSDASGNKMNPIYLTSHVTVYEQQEQGYAMAFGIVDVNQPDEVSSALSLIESPDYEDLLEARYLPQADGDSDGDKKPMQSETVDQTPQPEKPVTKDEASSTPQPEKPVTKDEASSTPPPPPADDTPPPPPTEVVEATDVQTVVFMRENIDSLQNINPQWKEYILNPAVEAHVLIEHLTPTYPDLITDMRKLATAKLNEATSTPPKVDDTPPPPPPQVNEGSGNANANATPAVSDAEAAEAAFDELSAI